MLEPKIELVTAAVTWAWRGLRLAFRTVRWTSDLDMKVLGVAIPGTDLEKPSAISGAITGAISGAISASLAAQRLLYRGIDQDADDRRILCSGADELGMPMGPNLRIDVELIGRDHFDG